MLALYRGITVDDVHGSRFRQALLESIGAEKVGGMYLVNDSVAVIVEVSAPGNAFSKLLDVMVAAHDKHIEMCLFITQTFDTAVYRNRFKQPDSNTTGNRIEFDTAKRMIETYCDVFFKVPIGIIGVGFNFDA